MAWLRTFLLTLLAGGMVACGALLGIRVFPDDTGNDGDAETGGVRDAFTGDTDAGWEGGALADVPFGAESSMEGSQQGAADGDGGASETSSMACAAGEKRCTGNAVETCLDREWTAAVPCDSGACNGAGVCGACSNGATRCSGSNVQTCTGGQWGTAMGCGGAQACIAVGCTMELTVSGASVTATLGLPLYGPVAFGSDANPAAPALSASIKWGDGSTCAGAVVGASGQFSVMSCATHLYATTGTMNVTVTVTSATGAVASVTYSATVRPPPTINLVPTPTTGSGPLGITAGPDGNIWFIEGSAGKIGRLVPQSQAIKEFAVPNPGTCAAFRPQEITAVLPGGDIWFTESGCGSVFRMTTAGTFSQFTPPASFCSGGCSFYAITVGADGNLWFIDQATNKIDRMTTDGQFTAYASQLTPWAITSGPDGNIWFTDSCPQACAIPGNIGKVTVSTLAVAQYAPPTGATNFPSGIARGPDGNLWFTANENGTGPGKIGRVSPSGQVFAEFATPTTNDRVTWITAGPDGNIWFTETSPDNTVCQIGRITPTGAVTEFKVANPMGALCGFDGIMAGPDGQVWFTDYLRSLVGSISP